jgi:3-methyl-2-oxobutanoate hydroxymethyltransferase
MDRINIKTLKQMKVNKEKFTCITCYDSTFAQVINDVRSETILVGDALGMVLQGHETTVPVTMEQMIYHTECVARGNKTSLILSDLPFMAYTTIEEAVFNSKRLLQAGAHVVKLEGGIWLKDITLKLSSLGVPVCCHLGLTPQYINSMGSYRVHGRTDFEANEILEAAIALKEAGASMLVLECVPQKLAAKITAELDIPVIGIGAGKDTDGQVLVLHDLLGITKKPAKFVKNFMENQHSIEGALRNFVTSVKSGSFPADEHIYC